MPLTLGTKLGPYEIQSPLGAGGMGEVYRARDTRLNRDVAIKMYLRAKPRPEHKEEGAGKTKAVKLRANSKVKKGTTGGLWKDV